MDGTANESRDNHDWKLSINKELSVGCNWQAVNHSRKRRANPWGGEAWKSPGVFGDRKLGANGLVQGRSG